MMFLFRLFPLLALEGDGVGGGSAGGDGGSGNGDGGSGGSGAGAGGQGGDGGQRPPWGSDEDFNPEKAWNLIKGLRADKDKLSGERDQLRGKVQEHERANESAQEKAQREKTEAEQAASTHRLDHLKLDVALSKAPEGMAPSKIRQLAKRLSGSTKEELEADADELFADFAPEGGGDDETSRRRPRERLRPGAAPSSEPEENDPRKLAEQIPRY